MCKSHGYKDLLTVLQNRAGSITQSLFTTDVDVAALWNTYLDNIPEANRQYYTCNLCRQFIQRFGGLVEIDGNGNTHSIMFDVEAPAFFADAWHAMRRMVETARVNGAFKAKAVQIGVPFAGAWDHFSVRLHMSHAHVRAQDEMIRIRENVKTMQNALQKYDPATVETALQILQSGSLYRSNAVIGPATFLRDLHNARMNAHNKNNIVWKMVASAPDGFCHPSSSMVGTLLDDIADGLEFDQVKRRFEAKMNPSSYQRATVAPSSGTIRQAEKLFADMGLAPALSRRFATFSEMPVEAFVWRSKADQVSNPSQGIFSSVTPRGASINSRLFTMEPKKVTWEKFSRDILPTAQKVEVKPQVARRVALVTAQNQDAPPILAWDNENQRNPFSWYYSAGIDGEIKRRLDREGGKYMDVALRASLIWDNTDDLDIHIISGAQRLYYGNKRAFSAELDVDANAGGAYTTEPVENVRWMRVPNGVYSVYVNCYASRNYGKTAFTVEIDAGGSVHTFNSVVKANDNWGNHDGRMVHVADIRAVNGMLTVMPYIPSMVAEQRQNEYVTVTAVVNSPNVWYTNSKQFGHHVFFVTGGDAPNNERGIITEMLRSDVKPVRSVIESYMADRPISGSADVVGYGINNDNTGNMCVRVTSGNVVQEYVIDRWD